MQKYSPLTINPLIFKTDVTVKFMRHMKTYDDELVDEDEEMEW